MNECQECGETERFQLLDERLEELGCEVVCEGCGVYVCLECGADVEVNQEVSA